MEGSVPRLGQPRFRFDSLDTTMRAAAEKAAAGAAEGTLILADEQQSGRGRLGRRWHSPAGSGLYFSLVLRPPVAPSHSMPLTLACGLGVARGIGETCGVRCDIRWPNDVLLNGKKCCGILVEMAAEGDRLEHVIVGVGVNVNQESMRTDLEDLGTSLRLETGCEWARDLLLEAILRQIERYYGVFLERGTAAIVDAFVRASSYAKGKRVSIERIDEPLEGVTAGLDSSGILLLQKDSGETVPIVAGSVRPLG